MKYVFIVHSHTLFLTSVGTMDYLGLDRKDVILLFTRGYRTIVPAEGCRQIFCDKEFARFSLIKTPGNRRRVRSEIRSFDRMVDAWLEGDCFELFVPHLWDPFFKLLHTHRKCKRVSMVQEGAFTVERYFQNHLPLFKKIRHRAASFLRWGTDRLYGAGWYMDGELVRQKSIDAYAIYPEFFRYLECTLHIVRWPVVEMQLRDLSDGPVFVFDGFVKHEYCSREYYLDACRRMAGRFAGRKNYLKFHPAQSLEEREAICRFFEGLDYQVLDDAVPLELYIYGGNHLRMTGMGSSLLYFAKAAGHEVHCCDMWLMEDPLYRQYHSQGVPLFDEYFNQSFDTQHHNTGL